MLADPCVESGSASGSEGTCPSARDPVVHGVAAADDAFVIRTGTRLFCIRGEKIPDFRRVWRSFLSMIWPDIAYVMIEETRVRYISHYSC
jgi:hypothetical protein